MAPRQKTAPTPEPEKKEVAVRAAAGALAVQDFGDDAGMGMENIGKDEFRIPFLTVLQSNSPQCDPDDGKYVPGALPGMILNTATGEMYSQAGGVFVPCHRDHNYPRYVPRDSGGGFVGVHSPTDDLVVHLKEKQGRFGKLVVPDDGTEMVETFYLYGIFIPDGDSAFECIVGFKSTQIKKYQSFVGRYMSIKYVGPNDASGRPTSVLPPLWAHRWRLATVKESNKKGKFFGWHLSLAAKDGEGRELHPIESLIPRSDELYQRGRGFYDLIKSGAAKADYGAAAGQEVVDDEPPL